MRASGKLGFLSMGGLAVLAIAAIASSQSGPGGLHPTAMERTLTILEDELAGVGDHGPALCDANGMAR